MPFLKENICLYIRSVFLLRREAINTSVLIEFSMIQFLTAYVTKLEPYSHIFLEVF